MHHDMEKHIAMILEQFACKSQQGSMLSVLCPDYLFSGSGSSRLIEIN